MSSAIKVVKRDQRKAAAPGQIAQDSSGDRQNSREIVNTVKSWIAESRDRRRAEAQLALQFVQGLDVSNGFEVATQLAKTCTAVLVTVLILLSPHGAARAQSSSTSSETLTLEQALDLALHNNHAIKIAQFGVDKADEEISVAKTSRLPQLHLYTLLSGNLAKNDIKIPNPAANQFPGLGPFFLLTVERKPSFVFATTAVEPLTQQYRIGLGIKMQRVGRELAQAKLRQQ